MPKRYRAIREQFYRVFRGTSAERARSITCGGYVNLNMGFAVGKLYIKKYFDENARNEVALRGPFGSVSKERSCLVAGNDWKHS